MDELFLQKFIADVHDVAKRKGWHSPSKTPGECMMMMVTEIAEAVEEIRKGSPKIYYGEDGKPEGEAAELADVLLRIFDYCEWRQIPIIKVMKQKNEYNKLRSTRHGGKLL